MPGAISVDIFIEKLATAGTFEGRKISRPMAQAVTIRPLIAEAQIRALVSPCAICGGQSDTFTGFFPSSYLSCQYHATVAIHAYMPSGG
jgi:hypothetical protein